MLDIISKMSEINTSIQSQSKDMIELETQIRNLDDAHFLTLARKITFYAKSFEKNKISECEYMLEIACINFKIDEQKYIHYQRIIHEPSKINPIKLELNEKIEELEKEKKILLNILSSTQQKIDV